MSGVLALVAAGAARGGLLLVMALLASLAMRRASAAARHAVLSLGMLAQLLVAFAPWVIPSLPVPYPAQETVVVEKAVDHRGASAVAIRAPGDGWTAAAESGRSEGHAAPVLPWLAILVWVTVGGAIGARYLLGHLRVGRVRSRSQPADGVLPREVLTAAAGAVGSRRDVDVRLGDIPMPLACGIARPAVLLPFSAVEWSRDRLRMVLVHELAHVRRRDVAIQGIAQLACALFWFDPLLWWVRARLRADAEGAADDTVLRAGMSPDRYVLELVRIVRETVPAPCPLAVASLGRDLESRARKVLDPGARRDEVRRRPLAAGAVLALVATLLLGAATPAARGSGTGRVIDGLATGCSSSPDGRHLNRWTESSGQPRWQVLWEGEGCEVEVVAIPSATLADGILAPPATGGRVVVRVRRGAATDSVALLRDDSGVLHVTASRGLAGGRSLAPWLRAFAGEVAIHTGFDAPTRAEELLRTGGVPAVLAYADVTQGDHAAGSYLTQLVARRHLSDDELVRTLRIATDHVSSDAAMTQLLEAVALRYAVRDPGPVREAFGDAAATLQAPAALEAIRGLS